MSFIRPEAAAGMNRWREALYGGVILALACSGFLAHAVCYICWAFQLR